MKKFFIFKNRGTAEIKVILEDGQFALGKAVGQLIETFNWRLEDVSYLGSRNANDFILN
jgi:hypothetical protein